MSLKNFHVFFISVAVLLAALCAAVAAGRFAAGGSVPVALAGLLSAAAAVVLVRYEAGFLRRCRDRGIQ